MKSLSIEDRAIDLAHYIIDSKDTVRGAAKKFGISKSTVHTEVTTRNGKQIGQYGCIFEDESISEKDLPRVFKESYEYNIESSEYFIKILNREYK